MRKSVGMFLVVVVALSAAACKEEGPLEKAGRKIDNAVDDAKDGLEDAADELKK